MDTPYELVYGEGLDFCEFNGPRLPGYVEGNSMKIYANDPFVRSKGTFGDLTYIYWN